PGQRVAHAVLQLTSPQSANKLIWEGVYVCKEKLHPRKEKREPICCVCCQGWGHIARECLASHDACVKCGLEHRTADCVSVDTLHCVSCNSDEHSSRNTHCPTYQQKCALLDSKHPKNSMLFYPMDEAWT
ncbi:hypothetical protein PAXRUDRAFT_122363, partial [Paxillus rubicundulus Ve08.2h10]